jgi:hypothetical protein
MRQLGLSQIVLAVILSSGCSRSPHIVYRHLTDSELVEESPIIVVGRIDHLDTAWKERRLDGRENGMPLFWYHVTARITVENVLRGDLSTSPIEYIYWLPAAAKVGRWNALWEGARYVHFLRRDGARLRSVVDFWPSAIRVTSGRHRFLRQTGGLRQTIARLMLDPGEDIDVARFNLVHAVGHAEALAGLPATVSLLEALIENSDVRIRTQACEMLRDTAFSPRGFANAHCNE